MESNNIVAVAVQAIAISFFVSVTVKSMMSVINRRAIAPEHCWRGKTRLPNPVEYYTDDFLMHLYLGFFDKFTPVADDYDECIFPDKIPHADSLSDDYLVALFRVPVQKRSRNGRKKSTRTRLQLTHITKYLHHRQYINQKNSTNEYEIYPGIPRDAIDMSHLCHNKQCQNPNHLCWEPSYINIHRNCCKYDVLYLKVPVDDACHKHRIEDAYMIRLPDCKLNLAKKKQSREYPIINHNRWPQNVPKVRANFREDVLN